MRKIFIDSFGGLLAAAPIALIALIMRYGYIDPMIYLATMIVVYVLFTMFWVGIHILFR